MPKPATNRTCPIGCPAGSGKGHTGTRSTRARRHGARLQEGDMEVPIAAIESAAAHRVITIVVEVDGKKKPVKLGLVQQ
jgi:hypothetical protein